MQDYMILVDLDTVICRSLARHLRAEHIFCRIVSRHVTADELLRAEPRGVLLATGCTGVAADVPFMMDYLQTGLPMLCTGDAALTLCQTLGGALSEPQPEGLTALTLDGQDALLADLEGGEQYLPPHRCMLLTESQGDVCASTGAGAMGFRARQRDVWGLAYPLDRNDPRSAQLLMRFCQDVCGCTPWWTRQRFIEGAQQAIADAADGAEALCALSGGVDSGVCALLGKLALGDRLHCIFVDTGLLRQGEADEVLAFYRDQAGLQVKRIDAADEFLAALDGIYAPADKERVIRRLLQEILQREIAARPRVELFLRGTNYADDPQTDDLPEGVRIIEPVRELFKDEIRQAGEVLGMSPAMTQRQPFPGSGLATRILSGVTAPGLALLREADAIFRRSVEEAGLHKRLWQYYATLALSPIPNGGYLVILRAVQASGGGSGMPARLPSDLLERTAEAIRTACPGVQRVLYDLSPSASYKRTAGI